MTSERWQYVKEVCACVSALDAAGRCAFLERGCADDAELRAQVVSLLQAHGTAGQASAPILPRSCSRIRASRA